MRITSSSTDNQDNKVESRRAKADNERSVGASVREKRRMRWKARDRANGEMAICKGTGERVRVNRGVRVVGAV